MNQTEMIAAAVAHRACCGSEHDPSKGKLHGLCIVCGVSWPCDTAKQFLFKKGGKMATKEFILSVLGELDSKRSDEEVAESVCLSLIKKLGRTGRANVSELVGLAILKNP